MESHHGNGNGRFALLVVARQVGEFLNVDSLVAFSQTSLDFWHCLATPQKRAHGSGRKDDDDGGDDTYIETLWQRIVQEQFLLYPEQMEHVEESRWADPIESSTFQETSGDHGGSLAPSVSWKTLALSMNNMMKGRYRIAFLNDEARRSLFPELDISSSCGSSDKDYQSDESSNDDESMTVEDDNDEEDTLSFVNDSPPPEPSYRVTLEGVSVPRWNVLSQHLMGHERREVEPHVWWAETLYSHYQQNLEEWGNPAGLPPWSYDHLGEFPNPLGAARSHSWYSDDNGVVVYASEVGDAGVVDLCSGDQIIHRLPGFGTQDLILGNHDLAAVENRPAAYNLLGGDGVRTTQTCPNWDCVYENYGWKTCGSNGGMLSVLNRRDGSIRTVYESETIWSDMKSCVRNLQVPSASVHIPVPTTVVPPDPSSAVTGHNDNDDDEEEEEEDYHDTVVSITVLGRLLVATARLGNGPRHYALVVDMKNDALLYAIHLTCKSNGDPKPLGGVFRGGVLSFLYDGGGGGQGPRHCRGIIFRPSLPPMNAVTTRLLDLWAKVLSTSNKENPFHRHPSSRIPLHTLIGAPWQQRRICCSAEQRFVFRLHFAAMVLNLPGHMVTPLVMVHRQGHVCYKSLRWSSHWEDEEEEEEEEGDGEEKSGVL